MFIKQNKYHLKCSNMAICLHITEPKSNHISALGNACAVKDAKSQHEGTGLGANQYPDRDISNLLRPS